MKRIFLFTCTFLITTVAAFSQNGFAIVIDETSYQKARTEVDAYADAINKDGLKAIIVTDKWGHPDSIRRQLVQLYNAKSNPIEGAVFIGDIPVAMISDAQHLTSAFKMDQQRFDMQRSSVPSDRFYDDFDLAFTFLKQDAVQKNYFYYSLQSAGAQKISPEIYTGRIRPFDREDKYEQLKSYLKKVVRVRQLQDGMDEVLYFGGQGYNSESMLARVDEKISLLEQFPWLKRQRNGINYIDHAAEVHIKPRLQSQLQKPSLKLALLHHHGDPEVEYLNGTPNVSAPIPQIEGVQLYLRSKVRAAVRQKKDTAETIKYYMNYLKVPESWFTDTFDPKVIEQDSIFNASLDITIPDVLATTPNVRFLILDACYNGSFHQKEYISGAYIFNEGNTIAVQANTVNALQDKWANEFLGIIGLGARVGQWSALTGYLESHIIGDPAYRFRFAGLSRPLSSELQSQKKNTVYWKQQLTSSYPEMQALALRMLYTQQYPGLSNLLLQTFKSSPQGIVRMECLKLLTAYNDANFIECLILAIEDSYELVQRQAVYLSGKSGDHRLIQPLVKLALSNNNSERIVFCLNEAISLFPQKQVLETLGDLYDKEQFFTNSAAQKEQITKWAVDGTSRWIDDVEKILSDTLAEKKKINSIRLLRNYNYHGAVESLCRLAKTAKSDEVKITLIEALGWFNISYNKPLIIQACKEILNDASASKAVKGESLKTINRLQSGWYR